MKTVLSVVATTLLTGSSAISFEAVAQVIIDPSNPKAFHAIRVKVPAASIGKDAEGKSDSFLAGDTQVTMDGNKILVSPLMRGSTDFGSPTPSLDQAIGALPPGNYQVEVVKRATGKGSPGKIGTAVNFTVPARADGEPIANFTDIWWLPSESGWGFGLFHHPSHQMFGTLYVYGSDGRPTWYVIPGGRFTDATQFVGPLYRATGPYFGGPFDPAQVQAIPSGSATIIFDEYDLDKASLVLVIDGVTFNKSVTRQSF